ncbi:MAG: arsenate reductase ArsC [Methanomicrobium sp.]|nr:arsenate reductase ArsC [Methanomicrobium sp.]
MTGEKKTVLFVCTHNSARSPMAEGILKKEKGDLYEVFSAGILPFETDRRAVLVMNDAGYDISMKKPASIGEYSDKKFDYIIFLCENAFKNTYAVPKADKVILHRFDMPAGSSCPLKAFANLRDKIKAWILDSSGL